MENETLIRLSVFLGLFALFAIVETLIPRRTRAGTAKRWFVNWGLSVIDTVTINVMAFVMPVMAVGAAIDATANGWGLLGSTAWPNWVEILLAILILDLVIWFQHMITHKIPLLWRLHQVHHSDKEMDVSTAIRFHPLEIALSMLLKIGVIYVLGPAAFAVILFEILLNGTALFNHSNIKLPKRVDAVMRLILVTPDMHRVHHSVYREEHDSNYGFSLSIWDRLFRTYVTQPKDGHDDMKIGLRWQDEKPARLLWTLKLPFTNK
ncbi:MAG: sterol desaturase family protein [Paracoccaceae bacterium]|jgi:sterol desaturase/sphingolipid hydroxylase (fatty acid hydroxylase superfamily)